MKSGSIIKIILFLFIVLSWIIIALNTYPEDMILFVLIGGPFCFTIISLLGTILLEKYPNNVNAVNFVIHYLILFVLSSFLIFALKENPFWTKSIEFPKELSILLILFFTFLGLLTVINLAISGLGAPFAISLTERISKNFLYRYSRNTMVLSTICLLVSIGLYYQSIIFILWTLLLVFPAFVVFLHVYEEKELYLRFGENYSIYKKQTSMFFPFHFKH